MKKVTLTKNQLLTMMSIFILGTSVLFAPAPAAKENAWLVLLIAPLWSLLLVSIYAALAKMFPEDTIIDYLPKVFGKVIGKLLGLLYVSFFFLLSALVLRNIGDFFSSLLTETPMAVIMYSFAAALAYILRKDFGVFAKVAMFTFPLIFAIIIFVTLSVVPKMDIQCLAPIIWDLNFQRIIHGILQASGWPFGEVLIFVMVMPYLKNKQEIRQGAFAGIILASITLAVMSLRNILILGATSGHATFTSLTVISLINLPGLGKLDAYVMLNQITILFVKVGLCYYAAVAGLSQWAGMKEYKFLVIPVGIVLVYLGIFSYESIADTFSFGEKIYAFYLFPLCFVIPLVTYLTAKIRKLDQRGAVNKAD